MITARSMWGATSKSKPTAAVQIEFLPSKIVTTANPGSSLSEVAEAAGVDIPYKCRKGECGTCMVNMNGKWTKACQTSIPPGTSIQISIKPALEKPKKESAAFFSPKSLADGFMNNALGLVGFVGKGIKADDEFKARMQREADLAAKLAAKKASKSQ